MENATKQKCFCVTSWPTEHNSILFSCDILTYGKCYNIVFVWHQDPKENVEYCFRVTSWPTENAEVLFSCDILIYWKFYYIVFEWNLDILKILQYCLAWHRNLRKKLQYRFRVASCPTGIIRYYLSLKSAHGQFYGFIFVWRPSMILLNYAH